ncbi:MAG: serine/threonine-protein kinase [Lysobacteraceae bacterium]
MAKDFEQLLSRLKGYTPTSLDAWFAEHPQHADIERRLRDALEQPDDATQVITGNDGPPGVSPVPDSSVTTTDTQRLGPWRRLEVLGRGGMGVVYRGERADGTYEQQVAIKLLSLGGIEHDAALVQSLRDRFENERRLLARLEHPNVARIVDGGTADDGSPYLVMEYVDGDSIDIHARRYRLDVRTRVQLLAKVCDGVQAAHRHLIVHRDLKPANILVDAAGEPRVLDFGIARLLDDAGGSAREDTELYAMTPAYASPEQVRREELTTTSDVYSLGVIAYELLTGSKPYKLDGLSPAQVERLISDTQPTTLRRALDDSPLLLEQRRLHLSGINDDLERIVAKALHKDPARRYDTAQALGNDLRRFLRGLPVEAHPDSVGYRLRRFVGRNRLLSAAAILTLLAILGGSGVALWQAGKARQAAEDTEDINAFLLSILDDSNPYESGQELTLGEAIDRAAFRLDSAYDDRPDIAVRIRLSLADSLYYRYRLDDAEAQYQKALSEAELSHGHDSLTAARALSGLGAIRRDQSRDDDAERFFQDALSRLERGGHRRQQAYGTALNDLGVLRLYQGRPEEAVAFLERSLAASTSALEPMLPAEKAKVLGNLAQAVRGEGNLDRAELLYRESQELLEALYPEGNPSLATLLNSRAIVAAMRDDLAAAVTLQQESVAMYRKSFTGDHPATLNALSNLARMAVDAGQLALADQEAGNAVSMAERLYAKAPHRYHADALSTLALVRIVQGRTAEAAPLLQLAEDVLAKLEAPASTSADYVDAIWSEFCESPAAANDEHCAGTADEPLVDDDS